MVGELALDDVQVVHRVAAGLQGGCVDDVHQGGAALDVPQELVAESAPLAGPLDESGNVGDRERDVAGPDHAEVGDQGRERVVGDLRPGPEIAAIRLDLPALGKPTRPMSATTLSSSWISSSSPGSPSRAKPGALRLDEASAAFPRPPRPPWATTSSVPGPTMSARTSPVSRSRTTVPSGTGSTRSSACPPLR